MQLFEAPAELSKMAANATTLASPQAASDIADLAEELITKRNAPHLGAVA